MALGVTPRIGFQTTSQGGMTKRRRLELLRAQLKNEFTNHEAHLRDLGEYIKPRRPRWYTSDRNKGDRRNLKIIDSTGTFSSRTLQAGMHSGMTSPARPWMELSTTDPDLKEFPAVKQYLHVVTQRMLAVFAQTNLYNALPVHYGDMGVFATAATSIMQDDQNLFRAYSHPIGSYHIATDKRGLINHWSYTTQKTVLEVVEEFLLDPRTNEIDWSKATRALKSAWDNHSYTHKLDVTWMVTPNFTLQSGGKLGLSAARSMPFYSVYYETGQDDEDRYLRESGFEEFPVLCSRWDVTGDDWWGTDCPGMVALGDIKQLQQGEKQGLTAIQKGVYPSLKAPTSMRSQKTSLLPADITYYDAIQGNEGPSPLHEVNLRLDHLEAKQENVRWRIRRAFYEDLFLMLAQGDARGGVQPLTATEVAERHEEKLIALGPVLERTNDELLDPLVDRVYNMMNRAGLLPEPPDELDGVDLQVEYTSLLAQAQKLVNVVAQERFLTSAVNLAQTFPQVVYKVDAMNAIDDLGDSLGVNPETIIPTDQAQEAFNQAQEQAAQAEQAAVAKDAGAAAQSLSNAELETDNALRRIAEGVV